MINIYYKKVKCFKKITVIPRFRKGLVNIPVTEALQISPKYSCNFN